MKDHHALDKLPLWASADLSPSEMKEVDKHIEQCPECRAEALAYTQALALLQRPMEPPLAKQERLSVRNSVMAEIRKMDRVEVLPPRAKRPYLLAVAAALPAALLLYITWPQPPNKQNTVAIAQPVDSARGGEARQEAGPLLDTFQEEEEELAPKGIALAAQPPERRGRQIAHAKDQPDAIVEQEPRASSVVRIEFQTENPNIKIIWVPQSSNLALNSSTTNL